MSQNGTGVEHEKASMMKQYFDIFRSYTNPFFKPGYLDRAPTLPSFTPSHAQSTTSRTNDLYRIGTSTSSPLYLASDSTFSGYPLPEKRAGYFDGSKNSFLYVP
jgi:hypothetical protein